VTGVASFIFLAHIGDQDIGALHFDFEGGDQRILGVTDNVSCFSLKLEANGKLHVCSPAFSIQKVAQFDWKV
jgi:hypothetical protein